MRFFIAQIIDFLLPRFCSHCEILLSADQKILCRECFSKIQHTDPHLLQSEFERKFSREQIVDTFYSLYIFPAKSPLQSAVHSLKYENNIRVGIHFGKQLAEKTGELTHREKIDLILPVPLHPVKKAERGYNQSYFLAKGLSKVCKIPVGQDILKRRVNTPSQTTLDLSERKRNIENAFRVCRPAKIKNKNLMLIDDVITTGATISECGRVLKEKGAKKIFALSIGLAE